MPDKVRNRAAVLAAAAAAMAVTVVAAPAASIVPLAASDGTISQITVSPVGESQQRWNAKVSDDGRFVAFASDSGSIVADDDNHVGDVFLYDATTGLTRLISRTDAGAPSNGWSTHPQLSANGKFIAFTSEATDLVDGVNPEWLRGAVYRYNVTTGRIKLVSKTQSGKSPRYHSTGPAISETGRYITYTSMAPKIVAGDHNGRLDVFRYDAVLDETIMVSQTLDGRQTNRPSSAGAISGNGRYLAYSTHATNMGPADTTNGRVAYRYDAETDTTTLVSPGRDGNPVGDTIATGISDNGKIVSLLSDSDEFAPGDTDGERGAFVYNADTDRVKLVSRASDAWPDGVDVLNTGVSGNGRYLVFDAQPGSNFEDSEVYLFDRRTSQTTKISVTAEGEDANGLSYTPSLSHNGNHIAFSSGATNLISGDPDGSSLDVFLWSRTVTP